MAQTLYLLNTNNNTHLCEIGTFDFDLGVSPGSGVAGPTNSVFTFTEVAYWDVEPVTWTVITGDHFVSVSFASITTNTEVRFRVQQIDAGTCAVINSSPYSSIFTSSSGLVTENLALTWTGTTGILRIAFEMRKISGSVKLMQINTNSDSYIIVPSMTIYSETGSGGSLAGGSASYFKVNNPTVSGGGVVGGSSTPKNVLFPTIDSNGVVGSGLVNHFAHYQASVSGGNVAGGAANDALNDVDIYSDIGSGGALSGGDNTNTQIVYEFGVNGAIAGGDSSNSIFINNNTDATFGGVLAGGVAEHSLNDNDVYEEFSYGGMVAGGESLVTQTSLDPSEYDGVVAGGTSSAIVTGSKDITGGVTLGGEAIKESSVYNYYPNGNYIIPTGESYYRTSYIYASSGGVDVEGSANDRPRYRYTSSGLSADAAPDFSGITIGFQSNLSPTLVETTFDIDLDFNWSANAFIEKDLNFNWNTGKIRQYWYRIVGNANQQKCEPIANCCMKYIMNVHARSIDDLCQKLRDRRWIWPIESVQKFSRPALNSDIAEDEANGIDHTCDTLEEVEVCGNLLCAEFCIDYDLVDYWGASVSRQINSFLSYESSGQQIVLGGTSDASLFRVGFDLSVVADGEVTIGGSSDATSSGYIYVSTGGIEIAGESSLVSTNWDFIGGEWPLSSVFTFGTEADQFNQEVNDQEWSLTDRLFAADDLHCSVDVSWGNNSKFLVIKGFPLNVPVGANILGIRVDVERKASSQVRDSEVYLVVGDEIVSDNLAKNTAWPIGLDAITIYGGIFNTWRDSSDPDYLGDWNLDDINNPEFGVAIRVEPITISSGVIAEIDFVKLVVIYEASTTTGLLRTGGESRVISSSYRYTGSGAVLVGQGAQAGVKVSRRIAPSVLGRGTLGPDYAGIRIGGQYGLNYFTTGEGEITIGGSAIVISSNYNQTSDGGVEIAGTSTVSSSCYHFTSDSGIELAGSSRLRTRYQYLPDGVGISVSGDSSYTKNYLTDTEDGIEIGGTSIASSSAYRMTSSGSISIGGSADYDFGNYGTKTSNIGLYAQALNVLIIFGEDLDVEAIEAPEDTVNACGCQDLPLSMQFAHNMFRNNQLSQFLSRNGLTVPRINHLHYNTINSAWQSNFRWKGYSTNSGQQEIWTVVFELTCTNVIGGESIGQNIWKLGVNFLQKNLSTGYDFDTKIVVGFLPSSVCAGADFRFKVTMDVVGGFSIIAPASSVYQSILYDNIGLFKTAFWQDNPDIEINVSQVGISELIPRYTLNV